VADDPDLGGSSSALAIVPFKPSLHAVLISVWAQNREVLTNDLQQYADVMQFEESPTPDEVGPEVSQSSAQPLQTVSLPVTISVNNPVTPLEVSSCRRSTRFSARKDKVFFELEANPRNKHKVWREVAQENKTSLKMLDAPPKPTDEFVPGPLPKETLKSWGILCDVAPEELTDQALLAEKTNGASNDIHSS